MPLDPPRGYRLRRAFIRTPLPQTLDPPQLHAPFSLRSHTDLSKLKPSIASKIFDKI